MTDGTRTPASELTPGALVHGTHYVIATDGSGTTTPVHSHRTVLTAERQGNRMRVTLGPDSHGDGVASLDVAYPADHVLIVTPAPAPAMIYASTKTHNTDPAPWEVTGYRWQTAEGTYGYLNDSNYHQAMRLGEDISYSPRPDFDQPRAHEGNPVLIAAREDYDGSDPWGFALAWLDAVDNFAAGFGYADAEDAAQWGASYERIAVWQVAQGDGSWTLPAATDEHVEHARRVFDRMADVARAHGRNY